MFIDVTMVEQHCTNCDSTDYTHVSDGITNKIVMVDLRCNICGVLYQVDTDVVKEDYVNSDGLLIKAFQPTVIRT